MFSSQSCFAFSNIFTLAEHHAEEVIHHLAKELTVVLPVSLQLTAVIHSSSGDSSKSVSHRGGPLVNQMAQRRACPLQTNLGR